MAGNKGAGKTGGGKEAKEDEDEETSKIKQFYRVKRFDFKIQFVWQPVGLNARLEILKDRANKRAERLKANEAAAGESGMDETAAGPGGEEDSTTE